MPLTEKQRRDKHAGHEYVMRRLEGFGHTTGKSKEFWDGAVEALTTAVAVAGCCRDNTAEKTIEFFAPPSEETA
jgi:hypothetical protein